jgi:exoribonuclease-2
MSLSTGCIVEFSGKGSQPGIAVVLSNAGNSVRLFLLSGKEMNLPEKKILHSTVNTKISVSNKEECKNMLAKYNDKRKELAQNLDLEEVYALLAEDSREYSLNEIGSFLFDESDEDSYAGLLRALLSDRVFFKHKKDSFVPASEDEVSKAIALIEKQRAQDEEDNNLKKALKTAMSSGKIFPTLEKFIPEIKAYAAGCETGFSKRVVAVLEKSGFNNLRKLFTFLVKIGEFAEDENLLLQRYRVPVEFDADLVESAKKQISEYKISGNRKDLRQIKTWAIDTADAKDRDDAFSFEVNSDGSKKLLIHIADPAEYFKAGSDIDKEAQRRGSSVYMPDLRIHMLPAEISEDLLSLSDAGERLALTIEMNFNASAELEDFSIYESVILVDKAIDYDTADQLISTDNWLAQAVSFSDQLKEKRIEHGALSLSRQPELEIKVVDGEIVISHRDRDIKTAGMIAEFMIWANYTGARWCHENSIPCSYRTQEAPDKKAECDAEFDPVKFFAILKTFKKTIKSMRPGLHSSLGLDFYTQITSPLRRYPDFLIHRQIKAVLRGESPEYSETELSNTLLLADAAIGRADELMRNREKYFLHKYLKNKLKEAPKLSFDGVIVDQGANEVNFYSDFFCSFKHCKKPNTPVSVGQKVSVGINQIDLFENIIRLKVEPV